jgi:DNA-binding response OmpR family regulator
MMPAKKPTILAVDDDPQMLRLVARNLVFEGYDVLTASNGELALEQIEVHQPNLVLLDVMMPKMDGFAVCQRVREFSTVPIIMVSARQQDKVRGLDLGADDYLTKPFSVDELLARVGAVLRRAQFSPNEHPYATHTTIGALSIDHVQRLVTMAGREAMLTPIEYSLLSYLAHNAGRIVLQDALLEHVWGHEYRGEGHLLQVNVSRLRHKLEPDPVHPHYIETKPGIGYRLAAPHPLSESIQVGYEQRETDFPPGSDARTLEHAHM